MQLKKKKSFLKKAIMAARLITLPRYVSFSFSFNQFLQAFLGLKHLKTETMVFIYICTVYCILWILQTYQ